MPGIMCLLFLWAAWIYATFIMDKKHPMRWSVATLSLILIILHPITIPIFAIQISGTGLFLLLISYFATSKLPIKQQLHLLFSVFTVMIGFAGFLLLEMFDPIWMFLDRKILISFMLFVFAYFVYPSSIYKRLLFVFLGTLQGDLIFALILTKWKMPYIIGSLEYLDILAITIMSLLTSNFLVMITRLPKLNKNKKFTH